MYTCTIVILAHVKSLSFLLFRFRLLSENNPVKTDSPNHNFWTSYLFFLNVISKFWKHQWKSWTQQVFRTRCLGFWYGHIARKCSEEKEFFEKYGWNWKEAFPLWEDKIFHKTCVTLSDESTNFNFYTEQFALLPARRWSQLTTHRSVKASYWKQQNVLKINQCTQAIDRVNELWKTSLQLKFVENTSLLWVKLGKTVYT